jgi:hypothetical protein
MKVPTRPDMSLPELPAPPEEKLLLPPHSHRRKLFMILLIVFIGIGIFMLFFTLQDAKDKKVYPVTQMPTVTPPQIKPEDSLKTFNDINGKFSFTYPKNYQVIAESEEYPNEVTIISNENTPGSHSFILGITYYTVMKDKTLNQLIDQYKQKTASKPLMCLPSNEAKNEAQRCDASVKYISYLLNNGIFYTFYVDTSDEYKDISKSVNDILDTLLFTNSANPSSVVQNTPSANSGAPQNHIQQICTEEAKQCPDGSWVGRTGPNCSFAACQGK